MDAVELHRRAVESCGLRVAQIADDQWSSPTPCADWSVRELVQHVVGENLWTPPLLAGQTVAEVGDRFDGDVLGDDPRRAWAESVGPAVEAAAAPGVTSATVHLSFGDFPGEEYLRQLIADLLVHGWDIARAIGADVQLDDDLVAEVAGWFTEREALYRSAGAIGAAVRVPDDASPADRLLAAFGRDPGPDATLAVIQRFNDAFGRADVDAVIALMTDDCVFESTAPPDGGRFVGHDQIRPVWEELFGGSRDAHFTTDAAFVAGDRGVFQWRYDWGEGHVRGVDLFRVRDGKVSEKFSYVKG